MMCSKELEDTPSRAGREAMLFLSDVHSWAFRGVVSGYVPIHTELGLN